MPDTLKEALILFTRLPLPGRTKTRLMPWLTPEQCAALHCAMLRDISETLRRVGGDVFIFYTPDGDFAEAGLLRICGDAVYLPQKGADLGERMDQATREVLGRGYASCLLLGSDIPSVTEESLGIVSDMLLTHDAVLAPTEDGGYWMVGLKQPCSLIFTHRYYGSAGAFEAARRGCVQANLRLAVGPKLRDIDEIADIHYYAAHPGMEMPHSQSLINMLAAALSPAFADSLRRL
ncbi:MAG: TIGR04282 family arsenosugar biosynthesis glycosyltransferase [Synergistaceae bacterium]|jgi:rSAM/selenodomain-associated transferase 1|nr:TIGR04282 family arsenosugar biosynthesis glycosyltransferase [Synergistaceae bacterium]